MKPLEIARRFAEFNQVSDARDAYMLALKENNGEDPEIDFEAASYIFFSGGKYEIAYTYFLRLYNNGQYQDELFDLMVNSFYAPNVKLQEKAYQKNCKLLEKYKYLFRKDFVPFDDLPVKFFPFDSEGFVPFFTQENRFGDYINFNNQVIDRYFFKDLENPILAEDVFSQYQLEYLNDNVRRSDWVAKDNHIYLNYTDWGVFCSYLQCLNLKDLLKDEKFVFLIEDEKSLYPIDFKERFDIDYSQYNVKPISVREIHRLIWHTQFAAHNGGDFFNEIFYGHPNLLADQSLMFSSVQENVDELKKAVRHMAQTKQKPSADATLDPLVLTHLSLLKDLSDKDVFVGLFLGNQDSCQCLDRNSRIAPALFFQPHFPNMLYTLTTNASKKAVLDSEQFDAIKNSPIFKGFKYIKTVTPMRRITTSYAATVKFMNERATADDEHKGVVSDVMSERLLNRSFMIDWQNRLYKDSILVRFEDGKLNPRATFTALAEFLDIPYTNSMTYCSGRDGINPESLPGNATGFDPAPVYRTYDDFANDAERYFLEYFVRDAYELYGYSFQYYDGKPMDDARARELISQFTTLNGIIANTWRRAYAGSFTLTSEGESLSDDDKDKLYDSFVAKQIAGHDERRMQIATILMRGLNFINKAGQPLKMIKPLKLDPALLEQPLYH